MKCKDCCSYRPSDFIEGQGTCKESLLTVTTDKECSLLLKEKQSQHKIINGGKRRVQIKWKNILEIITIFL